MLYVLDSCARPLCLRELLVKSQLKVQNKSVVKIKTSEKLFSKKIKISPLLKPPEKDFQAG